MSDKQTGCICQQHGRSGVPSASGTCRICGHAVDTSQSVLGQPGDDGKALAVAEPADPDRRFAQAPHDRVRLRRLVTYEGPRHWLEATLARSLHGVRALPNDAFIHAVSLDPFPVPVMAIAETVREQVCAQILEILGPLEHTDAYTFAVNDGKR